MGPVVALMVEGIRGKPRRCVPPVCADLLPSTLLSNCQECRCRARLVGISPRSIMFCFPSLGGVIPGIPGNSQFSGGNDFRNSYHTQLLNSREGKACCLR